MSSPRCPQCGQPLPDRSVACTSCGYDGTRATQARTNRILTLLLLFAMGICLVGACLVLFGGEGASKTRTLVGDLVFVAGFALYVLTRVFIFFRQRRRP
jgi:hypothetical protein